MDIGRYERMEVVVIDNSIPTTTDAAQPEQSEDAPEELRAASRTGARDVRSLGVLAGSG